MKTTLFRGCLITARFPDYEVSATRVLERLHIAYEFVPEFTCCGSQIVESTDPDYLLHINARNLAIAQAFGVDTIITLCGSCTCELLRAREALREPETRARVNAILVKEGLKYHEKEPFRVIHIINFLHLPDIFHQLVQAIQVQIPVRVALQLPCMAFRPTRLYVNSEVSEKNYREILQLVGVHIKDYIYENACCGGTMLAFEEKVGKDLSLLRYKVLDRLDVDFIVTACPNCHIVYTVIPRMITSLQRNPQPSVPPGIFFTQLLGLALGSSFKDVGLEFHPDRNQIWKVFSEWIQ